MPTWPFEFLGNNAGSGGGGGGGGTSYINSIQPFSITIAASSTSGTATITSVNTSNAVIFFGGYTTTETGTAYEYHATRVTLTNATTVTATRGNSDTSTVTVYGTVVEFTSAAMNSSVQYGTVAFSGSGTSATATITSVGSDAVVFYLGYSKTGGATGGSICSPRITLTNSTTVTANRNTGSSGDPLTIGFVVVDFASGLINSLQQRSVTSSSSTTTVTDTITSVVMGNTMLIYGGITTATDAPDFWISNLQLTSSTTVVITRGSGSSGNSRTANYTAVEFVSGILNSNVQRGTLAMADATSNTATISSVNTSKAVCNFTNFSASVSTSTPYEEFPAVQLTNATTVTSLLNTAASGVTSTAGYEVVEFA